MAKQTQNTQKALRSKLKTQNLALVALLILYIVIAIAHAALAPLTTGPDELAHYEYVHFIANHGRLPLDKNERDEASYKSDQPPLYHLLAALPATLVDPTGPPFLKRVQDHNRRQLIERTRHAWGLYNTEDEQWPYRAEILRWHVGRWVAILFGTATVAVTFFIARKVFAGSGGREAEKHPFGYRQRSRGAGASRSRGEIQNPKLLALAAAVVVAFIPRFVLTGSMLNYETTLAFFAALFLWLLLRIAWDAEEWRSKNTHHSSLITPRSSLFTPLLLGLFAGLAITAKLSALIFPLEIVIAYWLIGRAYGWPWKIWLWQTLIAELATLVAASWWFGFVMYQFNTVAEDGLWVGLLQPLIAADASDATTNQLLSALTGGEAGFAGAIENLDSGPPWEWASIFFRTFWMAGIEQQFPLGTWGLVIVFGFCLLAAYGLITMWRQSGQESRVAGSQGSKEARKQGSTHSGTGRGTEEQRAQEHPSLFTLHSSLLTRLTLSLLLLHLASAFILPLIRYAVTFSLADTAQGRHILFQTAPAFAILLIWGIHIAASQSTQYAIRNTFPSSLITHHSSLIISFLPGLFLLFWSLVQLQTMTWAYNPLLPVRTQSTAQTGVTLNQPLNENVTLLGYSTQLDSQNRVLRVDLQWRATDISPVDYLSEVSLLDAQGQVRAQWLGYPAQGRYPTRAWDAGDAVRDTVWLPTGGLDAGDYTLQLNLLPATLNPPPEQSHFEMPLSLGVVTIPDSTLQIFNSSLPFTGAAQASVGYSVWQNGAPLDQPRYFRYRETVLVTLSPLAPGQERTAQMVGLNLASTGESLAFEPARLADTWALFIVGPDWPSGDYRLEVNWTSADGETQWASSGTVAQVIDRWQRDFSEPPMQQRVEANFANRVKLLGYDLPANRAEPGGGIPLTLYWQSLDWLGEDYTIFAKLLKADDQTVHGGRDRLPREGYSTLYWAPGEIIDDPFGLPVKADAPNGIYTINVGLYKAVNGQAVSLPLVQDEQPLDAASINIGPIKIGDAPPDVVLKQANPQVALNQSFGNAPNLTLLGYDLTDDAGQLIQNSKLKTQNSKLKTQNLKLTLYWRSESPLPLDYTTFVHLRNQAGENVAQKDQPPLNGAYPTSLWDPGEIIADEIIIPLPDNLPAGVYQIVIGLYDFQTGQRLVVPDNPANEVVLIEMTLPQ